MANSKAISIRVPDELLEKIDQLAKEKYKSHKGTPNRSLVVLDAIVAYFDTLSDTGNIEDNILLSDSVTAAEFNGLRDIVSTLSDSISQLQKEVISLSDSVRQHDKGSKSNQEVKAIPSHTQLSTNSLSDSVMSEDSTNDSLNTETLRGNELAERLKVSPSRFSPEREKGLQSFIEWTKSWKGNPDKAGWGFKDNPKGKGVIYYRINEPLA
jgi:metal-responsive CopG/Arc/MetJ family transcriptional regulator